MACVVLCVIVVPAAAGGTTGGRWISPTVVLDPRGGSDASVALAPGGVAVAMWNSNGVLVTTRPAGGGWSPSLRLSEWSLDPFLRTCWTSPDLAVDAAVGALVACDRYDPSTKPQDQSVVAFERTGTSGSWRGPLTVSQPVYNQSVLALAADDAGEAVLAWTSIERYGDQQVTRAALRSADGTWEPPQNLGYAGSSYVITTSPSAAMDAQGDALVVWTGGPLGPVNGTVTSQSRVYAEFRPAGSAWGPAVVLSQRAIDDGNATVAMNRRGDALAVWGERDDAGHEMLISSFRRAGTSAWTPSSRIPITDPDVALRPNAFVDPPSFSFVLDDAGNATLVAPRASGAVEAVGLPAGATGWDGPAVLGDAGSNSAGDCVRPRIGLDKAGGAVVVWGGYELRSTRRPAGATTWGPSVAVDYRSACRPALAVSPAGDAVTIWNRGDRDSSTGLHAAVLDATPPVLRRTVIPRVAQVRRPVRFSVSATDLWSSLVRPPLWQFGDGSKSSGAVVYHAFPRPGRYRVSVTAIDQAANTTTSTANVHVTPKR